MLDRRVLRPPHPFPARMAASLALQGLRSTKRPLTVLDPLAGSGTTLVVAKSQGHTAIGYDTDPLAVLLATTWCLDAQEDPVRAAAKRVLRKAEAHAKDLAFIDSYPCSPQDAQTRRFIRYWFDRTNRRQLTALSSVIDRERDEAARTILWCAFSRLIITKQAGVSLAMDLAHSRPHRVRTRSTVRPFDRFLHAVETVLSSLPFRKGTASGHALIRIGDARHLPRRSESVDLVVTSPPYLNAIDYLRCHKFSLVWMGHSIQALRELRATNVGSEVGEHGASGEEVESIVKKMITKKQLPARYHAVLRRYAIDMGSVLSEIARVLVPGGKATLVVGDSTLRGAYVRNSRAIVALADKCGLHCTESRSRVLPDDRRYLPPPANGHNALHKRMRKEVVLTFEKAP